MEIPKEKLKRNPHDLAARMTGMESLRVLKICLGIWAKLQKENKELSEYLQWLADEADWDPGIWADWSYSIEQMIKEREEHGGAYLAYDVDGSVYHHCDCQDKDSWSDDQEPTGKKKE